MPVCAAGQSPTPAPASPTQAGEHMWAVSAVRQPLEVFPAAQLKAAQARPNAQTKH